MEIDYPTFIGAAKTTADGLKSVALGVGAGLDVTRSTSLGEDDRDDLRGETHLRCAPL